MKDIIYYHILNQIVIIKISLVKAKIILIDFFTLIAIIMFIKKTIINKIFLKIYIKEITHDNNNFKIVDNKIKIQLINIIINKKIKLKI